MQGSINLKKKLSLFIASTMFSTISSADEAYIGSFNILRLGAAEKDMVQTAKLLQGFDLVGLVEVINKKGIEELVDELNRQSPNTWEYHISPFGVGSSKYNGKSSLLREPYGATFKIGNFDFTLVLVHTIYGNNESQRKAENFKMVDVYDYFQDKDKKENDILIAGDFNLYALDESFRPMYKHRDKITYAIDPAIKTTIGTKGRANSYDNFFFSQKYTTEFTGSSGALDFSEKDPQLMRQIISDHIPVFIVVETSKDDD